MQRTILIVEDETFIAWELESECEAAGANVLGPMATLSEVRDYLTDSVTDCDGAILDIMLGTEEVFPVADMLFARNIPFVFHSAHAQRVDLEERFPGIALCRKPCRPGDVLSKLAETIIAPEAIPAPH